MGTPETILLCTSGLSVVLLCSAIRKEVAKRASAFEQKRQDFIDSFWKKHTDAEEAWRKRALASEGPLPSGRRRTPSRRIIGPARKALTIHRNVRPLWQIKGWEKGTGPDGGVEYRGYFRTPYGAYRSRIESRYQGRVDCFMYEKPECLEKHKHSACFAIKRSDGSYFVHFSPDPNSVDEVIAKVERVLIEAHEDRNCR